MIKKATIKTVQELMSEGYHFSKNGDLIKGVGEIDSKYFCMLGKSSDEIKLIEDDLFELMDSEGNSMGVYVREELKDIVEDKDEFSRDDVKAFLMDDGRIVWSTKNSSHHRALMDLKAIDITENF